MPAGTAYHPRATRADWNTPKEVVEPLVKLCGGPVDVDPCSNPGSIVPAHAAFSLEAGTDGLLNRWWGTAYVNPPFSELREWAKKCDLEAAIGVEVLLLMPARTDTQAWHNYVSTADCVLFWRGRLRFLGAEGPAPFPVALVYWGDREERFREAFSGCGLFSWFNK